VTSTTPQRAIIYVHAPGQARRWAALCLAHVERCGYELVSLVDDPDGHKWPDVVGMVRDGRAEVIVIAGREQLPEDRVPRVEVAEDLPEPPRRRPTIMR
jgi:hypothetical protein